MFHHISTHLGFRYKYQKQKVPVSCSIVGWNILPFQIYIYIHKYEYMHDIYIYLHTYLYIYTLSILVHILYIDVCVVSPFRFSMTWWFLCFGRPVLQVVAERHDLPLTSLVDAAQAWQKWSAKKKKHVLPICFFWCVCDAMFAWIIIIISPIMGGRGTRVDVFLFFPRWFFISSRWFKVPFSSLVGGHLTSWKGHLTITKRSLWITRLTSFCFFPHASLSAWIGVFSSRNGFF